MRTFSLPLLSKCDLPYSWILCIVDWWFVIDFSIQPTCPISRIEQSKKNAENICVLPAFFLSTWPLENETDRFSQNIGKILPIYSA